MLQKYTVALNAAYVMKLTFQYYPACLRHWLKVLLYSGFRDKIHNFLRILYTHGTGIVKGDNHGILIKYQYWSINWSIHVFRITKSVWFIKCYKKKMLLSSFFTLNFKTIEQNQCNYIWTLNVVIIVLH